MQRILLILTCLGMLAAGPPALAQMGGGHMMPGGWQGPERDAVSRGYAPQQP
jgi:hypothetical protein